MPTEALSPADSRSYVGFAKQATKGTGVAPARFAAYVDQISFGHNPNLRDVREAGGTNVIARQVKDFLAPGIQFATPMRPDVAGAILAYHLGAAGVPSGIGPYTHTITAANGVQWVTFERNIADDIIERLIDSVINEVTLDYRKRDSGPELMMDCTAISISPEDQAGATVETYETDRPFLRSDCTWSVDGTAPTNIESCTIGLTWQLDEAILADAVTRSSIVKLHLTGEVELVQLFESADEANAYRRTHYYDGAGGAGTTPGELVYPGNLTVTADYTDPNGANEQRQVEIAVPDVNWGEAELTENDPDASEAVRLTRRGVIVAGAGQPVTATIINGQSADYLA